MTQPSARAVKDSVGPTGVRLISFGITAHRFILAEINTHRVLSRSYRSSRAVPSRRLIEEVRNEPAMPLHWGVNRPGMQASEELDDTTIVVGTDDSARGLAKKAWRSAAWLAAEQAERLAAIGLHKQVANRVLEPFMWAHGIITATEWDNFFGLRLHGDAQPEFRALADAVWAAMKESEPRRMEPGANWHLPYFEPEDWDRLSDYAERFGLHDSWFMGEGKYAGSWAKDLAVRVSVARCARASYRSFDTGERSTVEEDLATYAKLNIPGTESYDPLKPIHASPAEHQATPDENKGFWEVHDGNDGSTEGKQGWQHQADWGNFTGWRQYRKMLSGEAVAPMPEAYR